MPFTSSMLSLYSPRGGGGKQSKRVPHPLTLGLLETTACTAQVAVGSSPWGWRPLFGAVGGGREKTEALPTPTCVFWGGGIEDGLPPSISPAKWCLPVSSLSVLTVKSSSSLPLICNQRKTKGKKKKTKTHHLWTSGSAPNAGGSVGLQGADILTFLRRTRET